MISLDCKIGSKGKMKANRVKKKEKKKKRK